MGKKDRKYQQLIEDGLALNILQQPTHQPATTRPPPPVQQTSASTSLKLGQKRPSPAAAIIPYSTSSFHPPGEYTNRKKKRFEKEKMGKKEMGEMPVEDDSSVSFDKEEEPKVKKGPFKKTNKHDDWDDEEDEGEEEELNTLLVHFDIAEMTKYDCPKIMHLLDGWIPDGVVDPTPQSKSSSSITNVGGFLMVDRDDFASLLLEAPPILQPRAEDGAEGQAQTKKKKNAPSPHKKSQTESGAQNFTSLLKITSSDVDAKGNEEEEEEEEDESGDSIFGVLSLIDLHHHATTTTTNLSRHSISELIRLLSVQKATFLINAGGSASSETKKRNSPLENIFLDQNQNSKKQTYLFVNEHLPMVPFSVVVQMQKYTLQQLMDATTTKNQKREDMDPLLIMLAKVQRKNAKTLDGEDDMQQEEKEVDQTTSGGKMNQGKKKKGDLNDKKGKRHQSTTATTLSNFQVEHYDFWREEEELYFNCRSDALACFAVKFTPQFDGQAANDIPLCVVFGIRLSKALEVISVAASSAA